MTSANPVLGRARASLNEGLFYPLAVDAQLKQQLRFYQELAALIKSGIPVYDALRHMTGQQSYRRLVPVLRECMFDLESGGRLSDAFARFPAVFSAIQIAILRAGEEGGHVEAALQHIEDLLERELRIRRFLGAETIYTKIVFVCCVFVVPALMSYIMGASLIDVFRNFLATLLPLLMTAALLILLFALARTALLRSESMALTYDRLKWRLPFLGSVTRRIAWAAFGRTLGVLYGAGVLPGEAIPLALHASGSRVLSAQSDMFARDLRAGLPLSVPLRESGVFPPVLLEYLVTGEASGDVDAMMSHVANTLAADGETRALQCSWVVSQLFFLLVAFYVTGGVLSAAIRLLLNSNG